MEADVDPACASSLSPVRNILLWHHQKAYSTRIRPTMSDSRDLSEEEIADLKEAFSMFDINGDGESIESKERND